MSAILMTAAAGAAGAAGASPFIEQLSIFVLAI